EMFEVRVAGLGAAGAAEAAFDAGNGKVADPLGVGGGMGRRATNHLAEILFEDAPVAARGAVGAHLTRVGPAPDGGLADAKDRTRRAEREPVWLVRSSRICHAVP